MTAEPLLSVRALHTHFPTRRGRLTAVDDVSFDISPGESVAVVGESGSGKSVTFLSVMGLVRPPGEVVAQAIRFAGRDLRKLGPAELRALRGSEIALTMQDSLSALNPALTIGTQITESLLAHGRARDGSAARAEAVRLLERVGIAAAAARLREYPHQFSGGQRQRVMIAIALACRPRLLIADEPTTALDVTIRAQVLALIAELRRDTGMALALVTHDLGVVAAYTARVMVMYAGQIVESGPTATVIDAPRHPYTRGLLASLPDLDHPDRTIAAIPGQIPDLTLRQTGCRFRPRCALAIAACATTEIALDEVAHGHAARCLRASELAA